MIILGIYIFGSHTTTKECIRIYILAYSLDFPILDLCLLLDLALMYNGIIGQSGHNN